MLGVYDGPDERFTIDPDEASKWVSTDGAVTGGAITDGAVTGGAVTGDSAPDPPESPPQNSLAQKQNSLAQESFARGPFRFRPPPNDSNFVRIRPTLSGDRVESSIAEVAAENWLTGYGGGFIRRPPTDDDQAAKDDSKVPLTPW